MPADITELLLAHRGGDAAALDRLVPLVYDDLRRIARGQLRRRRPGDTLNTTGLVHEAYVRLVDQTRASWRDRGHFFAVSACLRATCDLASDAQPIDEVVAKNDSPGGE